MLWPAATWARPSPPDVAMTIQATVAGPASNRWIHCTMVTARNGVHPMTKPSSLTLSTACAVTVALAAQILGSHAESATASPTATAYVARPSQEARRTAASPEPSVLGVFEGRTPCGAIAVEFTGFPAENCEKIKWQLTLYRASSSGRAATYVFKGTRATRRGTWIVTRGAAADSGAVVYRLNPGTPRQAISFLRADDNVLLLLDRELRLMVGDASWSYTLNRTDRVP